MSYIQTVLIYNFCSFVYFQQTFWVWKGYYMYFENMRLNTDKAIKTNVWKGEICLSWAISLFIYIFLLLCKVSVKWLHFLGKLPVLFIHLIWHQQVSLNANQTFLSAKEGNPLLPCFYYKVVSMTHLGISPVTSCTLGRRSNIILTLSLIRQFCSRRLWTYFVKK